MRKVQRVTGDCEQGDNLQWDSYCHGNMSQNSNCITRYSGWHSENVVGK